MKVAQQRTQAITVFTAAGRDDERVYHASLPECKAERVAEAEPIASAASNLDPSDAGLVANLALVQLLAGKLDAAAATVSRAVAMDATDKISAALSNRIDDIRRGHRAMPKTLRELERG